MFWQGKRRERGKRREGERKSRQRERGRILEKNGRRVKGKEGERWEEEDVEKKGGRKRRR